MNNRNIFFSVMAVLALGACNQEAVSHATYQCETGQIVNATFTDGKHVSVEMAGKNYSIPRVQSASGAKYESPETGTVFWSKGMDINFVEFKDGPVLKCQRT